VSKKEYSIPGLFDSYTLKGVTLRNRTAAWPMCQYMAKEGLASDWNLPHGFLAQSLLSKHSNVRDDAYGGSLENRSRFLVETVAAVRRVWPTELPLTTRLGVLEFDGDDDANLAESIEC
jgi:2,4-dienoyl-CoA reductase-like NADH-dependent reductase (Old Yellow Enzyme family)